MHRQRMAKANTIVLAAMASAFPNSLTQQCNRTLGFLALSRCNAAGQKIFGQKTGYGRRAPAQNRESAARAPPHTGYALIFQQPHSPQRSEEHTSELQSQLRIS